MHQKISLIISIVLIVNISICAFADVTEGLDSNYEPIFHYNFETGFVNLVTNQDEISIIEHSDTALIEDGQLKLIHSSTNDPRCNVSRVINTSNISKLLIEKKCYIIQKGEYSLSGTSLKNEYEETLSITYNYYHYSAQPHVYPNRNHFYIFNAFSNFSKNDPDTYIVSNLLETSFSKWINELIEIDYINKIAKYEFTVDNSDIKQTAILNNTQLRKSANTTLSLSAWDWASGSSHFIDSIKVSAIYGVEVNNVTGKLITAAEILGYTACVGGATVKSSSNLVTAVTDIYGNFNLSNMAIGENIIEIESTYFAPLTKTVNIMPGKNLLNPIEIYKPKCDNLYTQKEVEQLINNIESDKNAIIADKDKTISELSSAIASMYTQGYLDNAIIEAEKRGELKYDINNDGKVGLEEVIKYLETLSGVRIESLIIFPEKKQ